MFDGFACLVSSICNCKAGGPSAPLRFARDDRDLLVLFGNIEIAKSGSGALAGKTGGACFVMVVVFVIYRFACTRCFCLRVCFREAGSVKLEEFGGVLGR